MNLNSREADLEESIFSRDTRSAPVGWLFAILVVLVFSGWLVATQTNLFNGQPNTLNTDANWPGVAGDATLKVDRAYFTWRNTKAELTKYLTELTQTEVAEYLARR